MQKKWTLIRGDALRELERIESESVDAVIADPPYSSVGTATQATGAKYVQSGTKLVRPDFAGDTRDQRSWMRWATMWLSESLRVAKPGAVVCVFTDWRQMPSLTDAIQCAGWIWQGVASWDKTLSSRPRMGGFRSQVEFIVWGSKGKLAGNREVTLPGSLTFPRTREDRVHHQTSKPVELMRQLVKLAPPGGLVLDPFAGSATTGVAAVLEGRRFHGFELVPAVHEIAERRLNEAC